MASLKANKKDKNNLLKICNQQKYYENFINFNPSA